MRHRADTVHWTMKPQTFADSGRGLEQEVTTVFKNTRSISLCMHNSNYLGPQKQDTWPYRRHFHSGRPTTDNSVLCESPAMRLFIPFRH
ncbi:hypothetical protein JOB18_049641 [Solea senegalensis]|uniref:Uncharacterized protein n=1 Tax=Solea senegalensis TaxID=28829 RepID=A0AAV6R7Q4_SOLSE|nr:hypothetical protein JOB18_049641 [Solea senegalensis]